MNFSQAQAASRTLGSSEVEVIMAALPPAGRPIGLPLLTPGIPGKGPVLRAKSPLVRSTVPSAEVDQNNMPTSPAAKEASASFHDKFCISHSRKIRFMVSNASVASLLSRLMVLPLTMGLSCDHSMACMNQLPVMFQPQKIGFLMPFDFITLQALMTSSQLVGNELIPPSFRISML